MIDFFSERIGLPYPHPRYSQITVPEFIFGGHGEHHRDDADRLALLDERAALDHDIDGLVSHELAHQWWGDLLTCREWSEAWLNEGFATYFEYVWREHAKGRDEADLELLVDADGYLTEAGRYQRPVVCRQYEEPIHLFDAHLYEKGGRVLHMLRHEVGDAGFWRAITHYARKHARGSVETRDLARAVEETTGRNVDALLDRWIARPGHPELEGRWEWDEDRKVGVLRIAQTQAVTPETPLFRFSVDVRFEIDGQDRDERVTVSEASHTFEFPLPGRPSQVIFDSGDVVLKSIRLDKGRPLWRRQLAGARLGIDRIAAARALGGSAGSGQRSGPHHRAGRRSVSGGCGRRRRARSGPPGGWTRAMRSSRRSRIPTRGFGARWSRRWASSWATRRPAPPWLGCSVEAMPACSWRRRPPRRSDDAHPARPGALAPSHPPIVPGRLATRAIEGLGRSGDERALPFIREAWRPGRAGRATRRGVGAGGAHPWHVIARAGRELVEARLADRDFRVRGESAAALARLGQADAIPAIRSALAAELDGRARRRMMDAIRDLEAGTRPAEEVRHLHDEVERLRVELARTARADGPGRAALAGTAGPDARRADARSQSEAPAGHSPAAAADVPAVADSRRGSLRSPKRANAREVGTRSGVRGRRLVPQPTLSSATMSRAICRARASSARGIEMAPTTG